MRVTHMRTASKTCIRHKSTKMRSHTATFTRIKKSCLRATLAKRCAARNARTSMRAITKPTSKISTSTTARTTRTSSRSQIGSFKISAPSIRVGTCSSYKERRRKIKKVVCKIKLKNQEANKAPKRTAKKPQTIFLLMSVYHNLVCLTAKIRWRLRLDLKTRAKAKSLTFNQISTSSLRTKNFKKIAFKLNCS